MTMRKSANIHSGIYYCNKQILKFQRNDEMLSSEDLSLLFDGVLNLMKRSIEKEVEKKYLAKIFQLEKEIDKLKSCK